MVSKRLNTVLAVVVLMLFLSAKFAVYHTFSHDNECVECCKVCDLAAAHASTPFLLSDGVEEPVNHDIPERVSSISDFYKGKYFATPLDTRLFSRPPPVIS